ncbi:MAG: helix-turn-helix domain-containing protein [Lachnospiraceae bacterium]
MNQVRYMISDAAKMVEVESHVLRYWEEELELPIARNEMGHRYYTEDDIQLLKHIKKLKERGYQLKAIKMDISENGELIPPEETKPQAGEPEVPAFAGAEQEEKMLQFQAVLSKALGQALRENQEDLGKSISVRITDQLTKEMNYQFREHEEQEELHFKKLDETMRNMMSNRKESARRQAKEKKNAKTKKRHLFSKKKERIAAKPLETT